MSTTTTTTTTTNNNNNDTKELISTKLKFRLSQLTAAASKETIQTLSNWILFHSKTHPEALRQVLLSQFMNLIPNDYNITNNNTTDNDSKIDTTDNQNGTEDKTHTNNHQMFFVYWKILYEICIRDSEQDVLPDESRFASSLSFRVTLAEHVIQPVLQSLAREGVLMSIIIGRSTSTSTVDAIHTVTMDTFITKLKQTLQESIDTWRNLDCFDSISLMDEIQRIMDKIHSINPTENLVMSGDETKEPRRMKVSQEEKEEKESKVEESKETQMLHTVNASVQLKESEDAVALDEMDMDFTNHDDIEDDEQEGSVKDDEQEGSLKEDKNMEKEPNITNIMESTNDTTATETTMVSSTANAKDGTEYDFEAENIPFKEVSPQQLMESVKAMATMQITRDLRNDNSHTLSTLLNKVPTDVFQRCKELLQEQANKEESVSSTLSQDIISMIPDDVLDLDIDTCLNNVRLHRDIILKQKQLRQECTTLLIQSRCEFGSHDAAVAYYTSVDDLIKRVESVQEKISDAAELEGLDFENNVSEEQEKVHKLKDFDWFSKQHVNEDHGARKKQKVV